MVSIMTVKKFQIELKIFKSLLLRNFLLTLMRLKKNQKMITIWLRSSSLTCKTKVITCDNNSSKMFYIINELVFNEKLLLDEVRHWIWDWKSICQLNYSILKVEYEKVKKKRRMKKIIGTVLKKRARDANYSETTNTERERVKSEWKEKLELQHSSLENQFWSWILKYEGFLFCF